MLHIKDLHLTTPNGQTLLHLDQLTVKQGETVWLRAPSGFGKSTFYRAVAGFWPHGTGTISTNLHHALFLPQKPYFPQNDLYAAVSYPHPVTDFDKADLQQAIKDVGLGNSSAMSLEQEAQGHPLMISGLSGGELQRLSLARALIQKPQWLFLDEGNLLAGQTS